MTKSVFIKDKIGTPRRKSKKNPPNKGLLKWLLKCPVKGFFVPFESSETTDDIKSPFE